VVKAKVITNFG